MIRSLFQFLFGWPCDHAWTEIDRQKAIRHYPDKPRPFESMVYAYRCGKCGEFRTHEMDAT